MSSASYIPLTQISPSEFLALPKQPSQSSFRHYFSRRRAVIALLALSSIVSLAVFLKLSLSQDDAVHPIDLPINYDYEPNYIAVPVPDALPPGARPVLRPTRDLPTACLEDYYAHGGPCHDSLGPQPIDVIWTWVNGSDPLFLDARDAAAFAYSDDDPYRPKESNNPSRMFRDHDELRHSVRSVLHNFRPYAGHFRIVTSDLDYPEDANDTFPDPGPGYWRLGLQPQWLETEESGETEWRDGDVQLSLVHHAHFFDPYNRSIFNSYAIESQFSHLQDLSDTFIYFNDDFYMVAPLTPQSFYTHQYGTVLRITYGYEVPPDWPVNEDRGEWKSMGVSNFLLSKRFGRRNRPYVQHQAKSVSYPLLQEVALVWKDMIAWTGGHAFRETVDGDGDFYQMFVVAHYIVERAREAMLWAWVVGRVGALDDSWGQYEDTRAWVELGGGWDDDAAQTITVESDVRETLDEDRVRAYLKEGGIEGEFHTKYLFSSLDGYAYNQFGQRRIEDNFPGFETKSAWESWFPDDNMEEERERRKCTIKRDECFGVRGPDGGPPTASEVFKRVAFENVECGDCIITQLVRKSGPLGLATVLPHASRRTPASGESADVDAIPHLPLVDDWKNGQFALKDVMRSAPDTSIREWSMRLMQRYRYVIGQTPSQFEQMVTMRQVLDMVARLDRMKDLALLCINDDVAADHDEITAYIRGWQEKRWGTPAAWEADVPHHKRRDDADAGAGQSRIWGEDVIPVEEYEPDPRYWR